MASWGDDAALDIYRRAFEIAELDPDPDRDAYTPETTYVGATRPFRYPPDPDPDRVPDPGLVTGRAIREAHRERDDLKAALRDALATNRAQAARLREMTINARVLAVALALTLGWAVLFAWRG